MGVRLLFTIADNEGHRMSMRYKVLSPFPPSTGDHVDLLGKRRASSNSLASSTLRRHIATGSARRQANGLRSKWMPLIVAFGRPVARSACGDRLPASSGLRGVT